MIFVSAPFSVTPVTTGLYAAATWVVLALTFLYWQSDYDILRRVLVFTGFAILAWLYLLLAHHGLARFWKYRWRY